MSNQTVVEKTDTEIAIEQDCNRWVLKNRPDLKPTSPFTIFKAGYSAAEERLNSFKRMFTDVIIEKLGAEVEDLKAENKMLSDICKTVEALEIKLIKTKDALSAMLETAECRDDGDCDHCVAESVLNAEE